jgi:hypothetical protein
MASITSAVKRAGLAANPASGCALASLNHDGETGSPRVGPSSPHA